MDAWIQQKTHSYLQPCLSRTLEQDAAEYEQPVDLLMKLKERGRRQNSKRREGAEEGERMERNKERWSRKRCREAEGGQGAQVE